MLGFARQEGREGVGIPSGCPSPVKARQRTGTWPRAAAAAAVAVTHSTRRHSPGCHHREHALRVFSNKKERARAG
jgi:hypothetical protein